MSAARRRAVPPPVQTDKLGRWVQDGFAEGVEYLAVTTAPGITFSPARSRSTLDRHHLRTEGTAATFSASGVARTPPLLNQPGKPPGIPGVQVSFLRIAGRSDLPTPAASHHRPGRNVEPARIPGRQLLSGRPVEDRARLQPTRGGHHTQSRAANSPAPSVFSPSAAESRRQVAQRNRESRSASPVSPAPEPSRTLS